MYKRYLQNTKWVRNALAEKEFERFKGAVEFFKQYSQQYNFDWLMIAALAYQESGIDQTKRSRAGAVGVMQLLPSTAADPNVNIRKIEVMEHNIHAGVPKTPSQCGVPAIKLKMRMPIKIIADRFA